MFIELHFNQTGRWDGKRLALNVNRIIQVNEAQDGSGSVVTYGPGDNDFYKVKETYEEVLRLLNESAPLVCVTQMAPWQAYVSGT